MEERRGANSRRSRSIFFHNRAFLFFSFFFYIKWLIRVEEETLISRKHRIRANSRVFRRRNRYTEITSTAFQSTFQKRNRACIGAGCGRGWKSWNILNSTARRGREEGGLDGKALWNADKATAFYLPAPFQVFRSARLLPPLPSFRP